MAELPTVDLSRAEAALARRDLLTAVQIALRAAGRRTAAPAVRCGAYRVLALSAVQLDSPEPALAYAVAGSLTAQQAGDESMSQQADEVLRYVLTRYPDLSDS